MKVKVDFVGSSILVADQQVSCKACDDFPIVTRMHQSYQCRDEGSISAHFYDVLRMNNLIGGTALV